MRCLSFYHLRDIRRSWCLSSHVIWRVPCGDFEHQRRVQFQGCDAKRLQTHHAILFGSGWSCLFLPTVLQDALSEVIKVLPTHVVEGVCGRHHNFLGGGVHKEGRYHFWPRRLLARSFYHFWPRPLLAQTALWPFPACAKVGPRRVGPRRVGPRRVGPRRVAPEISRFFSLSRHNVLSFFPLLEVLSWNFGRGSRPRSTQSARLGFSGVTVRAPTAHKLVNERSGFHKMTPGTPNAHFGWTSALIVTTFPRDHLQEIQERTKFSAGEGTKERNFGVARRAGSCGGLVRRRAGPKC